jgi:NAD dependent epimerase/dehydratase family enzyme
MLLKGQRFLPGKLLDKGFRFHYPDIGDALNEVVKDNS